MKITPMIRDGKETGEMMLTFRMMNILMPIRGYLEGIGMVAIMYSLQRDESWVTEIEWYTEEQHARYRELNPFRPAGMIHGTMA